MKILVGADLTSFELKNDIKQYLQNNGETIIDITPASGMSMVSLNLNLAAFLNNNDYDRVIVFTQLGISSQFVCRFVLAKKAALGLTAWQVHRSRSQNDTTILSISSILMEEEIVKDCVDQFISTSYWGGSLAS